MRFLNKENEVMEANKVICFQSNFSVKKSFGLKKQAMYRVLILIGLLNLSFSLYSQDISFYNTEFILLYQHKENHLKIMVEGYECKDIVVEVNEGKIRKEGCDFVFTCDHNVRYVYFYIGKIKRGKTIWVDSIQYRVRKIPDPEIMISTKPSGEISIGEIRVVMDSKIRYYSPPIEVMEVPSWDWNYTYSKNKKVNYFELIITRNETQILTEIYDKKNDNNCDTSCYQYPKELIEYFFKDIQSGDILTFSKIEVILYGVEKRKYEDRIFIIR